MATSNTLTNLIPTLYNALDVVSREMVGFIPAVSRDSTHERAAIGQTVRSFVAPPVGISPITPGVNPANAGGQTIGSVPMTITRAEKAEILWSGEEQLSVSSPGITAQRILQDQFAQAMRSLVNAIEADLGAAAYAGASRAVGTVGTNPFVVGSDASIDNIADVRKVLTDNGAPLGDLQLVIDSTAGAGLRKVPNLYKVNEAGDSNFLRRGVLGELHGFEIRESVPGVARPTVGTVTATTNNAGYAVGATAITLSNAAVDLKRGDVITFANDVTQRYVVAEDIDGTGGVLRIAAPGLRVALPTSTQAIVVLATGPRNVAFSRSAIYLATRAPAAPLGGDSADDVTIVQDPLSGIAFEVSLYRMYRQVKFEVAAAWGVVNTKSAHSAILLG
jgi:hypothetical protein